jgi:DNA-binding response OmpR family regulator
MKIYIIEDDEAMCEELIKLLERYEYETAFCKDFQNVIENVVLHNPDLVLLDINLPYKDGYEICRELRTKMEVPIIMLTAQNSVMEEVMGLKTGADDFIAKPYHPQVLLAHIESVLKRVGVNRENSSLCYQGVQLDLGSGKIVYEKRNRELTKNEIRILQLVMRQPGQIVSREEIMEELWQSGQFIDENTLNVNIVRLRKKLSEIGLDDFVKTKRGMGYLI